MRKTELSTAELALLVGTRAAGGLGLGLLLADHLPPTVRRPVGWTLVLIGLLSTVPLAIDVLESSRRVTPPD